MTYVVLVILLVAVGGLFVFEVFKLVQSIIEHRKQLKAKKNKENLKKGE